jgi:LAS superfamily LD-carboxypeptidase LdcB
LRRARIEAVNTDELTGRARTHIVELPDMAAAVHHHVAAPLLRLRRAARESGFEIGVVSSFRDFNRQLASGMENTAASGRCSMRQERSSTSGSCRRAARIAEILRWSALPGASRHHWGTDLDLVDRNAIPAAIARN